MPDDTFFRDSMPLLLRSAYLSMHRYYHGVFAGAGVTADQFVLLKLLSEEDGVTQKTLGELAYADANSTMHMLNLLEKRGLVKRRSHPGDGRATRIFITRKARQLISRIETQHKPPDGLMHLFLPGPPKSVTSWLRKTAEGFAEHHRLQKHAKRKRRVL